MEKATVPNKTDVLQRLLASFGAQNKVHRVYVFSFSFSAKTFSNIEEWCSEGERKRECVRE